ncbi:MAG: hypothetical protein CL599_17740 [Alteromonas sp.]|nr:hypothetical protein [Alteromonas sp.]
MPLILPQHDSTINMWLDNRTDISVFTDLLTPHLPQMLLAQRIDKPSTDSTISKPVTIKADI